MPARAASSRRRPERLLLDAGPSGVSARRDVPVGDRSQRQRQREFRKVRLHQHGKSTVVVGEPDLRVAVLRETAARLDRWTNDCRGKGAGTNRARVFADAREDDRISVGYEIPVVAPRLANADAGRAHGVDERAVVEWIGDAGLRRVVVLLIL